MVLVCAWWAASLLRAQGGLFAQRIPVFAAIGSVLLIVPAADLGQREHLLIAAFLPYLVLFAQSLDAKRAATQADPYRRGHHGRGQIVAWVVAGALAGLGCALKPPYAAVFVALECLALTRGLRPWRVMPLAAATTMLIYGGLVVVLCPAFLQRAVPMALALYGATDVTFQALLSKSALLICCEAAAIVLLWLRRRSLPNYNLMLTTVIVAVTSFVVCFLTGKDWYYHRIPAIVATVLALILWLATELSQRRWTSRTGHWHRRWYPLWPMAAACLAVVVLGTASVQEMIPEPSDGSTRTTVRRLEHIIRVEHARTYVAFSEWLALGFPVVNETGVNWASRFDSMWALKGEVWRARFDPAAGKEWPIAHWVAHDFIAGCPDIAVVDTRETTPYLRVLEAADPAFARVWTRYRLITTFDGLAVYRRSRAGCMDVWVAAGSQPARDIR
jgi:uncharacterized membrane protein